MTRRRRDRHFPAGGKRLSRIWDPLFYHGWLIWTCTVCGRRYWFHRDSGANRWELAAMEAHIQAADCDLELELGGSA